MSELEIRLKEKREELNRLIGARDFNSVVALHTPDVKFMAPHMDLVDGRINLYQLYSKSPADAFAGLILDSEEIIDIGNNLAIDRGRYHIKNKDGGDTDYGKFMICWKKEDDGEWYIKFDVSQTDKSDEPAK